MHWCGDESLLAIAFGNVMRTHHFGCISRWCARQVWRVDYWWESLTSLERRDVVWFWIWIATVIGLSL